MENNEIKDMKRLETKPCNNNFKDLSDEARNNLNKRYYFDNTSSFW